MALKTRVLAGLTTAQVAARLGVKTETVYAYVSRGLLTPERGRGGRASTFDPLEVEALAARAKGRRKVERPSGGPPTSGSPLMVIDTALTLIEDDMVFYRGLPAIELAGRASFEEVAHWFVTGSWAAGTSFELDALPKASMLRATAWRRGIGLIDRLRIAVSVASSANPLRYDLDAAAVVRSTASLIAAMVAAVGDRATPHVDGVPIAARLWEALTNDAPGDAEQAALNSALVLLVDHDLAASTLAARVAASARAHPYSVVAAGLGPLDGLLHGAVSAHAHRMLAESLTARRPPLTVVTEVLRSGNRLPGFGHSLYTATDPRYSALLAVLEGNPALAPALQVARDIADVVSQRTGLFPNIDLALAVITAGFSMRPDSGEAIFAVARTAGWIGHALEEYDSRPLRLRPAGHYVGPDPGDTPYPEGLNGGRRL
jgi:citrate synthase